MATLIGNALECKKQIKEVLKKINEGKYEIDSTLIKVGTKETKPVKDKNGQLYRNFKRSFHDTFIINYIDKEIEVK